MPDAPESVDLFNVSPSSNNRLRHSIFLGIASGISLALLAFVSPSIEFTSIWSLVAAVIAIGVVNAVVAPAISFLTVPLSVLTLGIGAIIVDGFLLLFTLRLTPGVDVSNDAHVVLIALAHAAITAAVNTLLTIDDDKRFDRTFQRQLKKHPNRQSEAPRTLMIQIDGLGHEVLRRAMREGSAPTLYELVRNGSYQFKQWETDWSSQTGASQRGILMGSNDNMPAFRWFEKDTGKLVVSNKPASAKYLESLCPREEGLLSNNGASIGNIFTGGADRAIMTMSVAGKKKGRIGSGYAAYFSRPYNATRTAVRFLAEMFREIRSANIARSRNIYPAVPRDFAYAFARAATTVVMQDVSINAVMGEMVSGRDAIYVDLLGYDEVAHHVGPERPEALDALRRIDGSLRRILRFAQPNQANYRVIFLSDHGQAFGQTFLGTYNESLGDYIERLCKDPVIELNDTDHEVARDNMDDTDDHASEKAKSNIQVMASGNLGLVYFGQFPQRATKEELDAAYPNLIAELVNHPGIDFLLVKAKSGSLVIGPEGQLDVSTGNVTGKNPLEKFGPLALRRVQRTDGFEHVADLMINASWDPETDMSGAFEELVGSHGGMGGEQSRPFILAPESVALPEEIFGAEQIHKILKQAVAAKTSV